MNLGVSENDRVPWPLGQWRWWLADDSIDMRYTYVGIDARGFTYQFLGELFLLAYRSGGAQNIQPEPVPHNAWDVILVFSFITIPTLISLELRRYIFFCDGWSVTRGNTNHKEQHFVNRKSKSTLE